MNLNLYYGTQKTTQSQIEFGAKAIRDALKKQHINCFCERINAYINNDCEDAIVLRIEEEKLQKECFNITIVKKTIIIEGGDPTGVMYGALDLAESIELHGLDSVKEKSEKPFLKQRGIKFNLPYEPYAKGDVFSKNESLLMTIDFWKDYIEFLAKNRYNCLSLWSENPFEMMFRLDKYPNTTPYDDIQIAHFSNVYHFIFDYSKSLGIETFLFTWNIRITSTIAKGLGLPSEIGERPHDERSMGLRQNVEIIKDYFREAVKTLLLKYPSLTGMGTSNSEEFIGNGAEREPWIVETYLQAILELNIPIPFIHRTNQSSGTIAQDMFLNHCKGERKYISWKYSNAHMYSHAEPQFEELYKAWDGIDFSKIRVLFTVRNDDFHNLRGCNAKYISAYIKGMNKPYADGFYWGADGYVWAGEFMHKENLHVLEKNYSFEKHWVQFEMIGRLSYNPELPESLWTDKYIARYGEAGKYIHLGLSAAIDSLCAINRLIWVNYDYQWHPETVLSCEGFRTISDFMDSESMPGVGVIGMKEYLDKSQAGISIQGETPIDIIDLIAKNTELLKQAIDDFKSNVSNPIGELECILFDLEAWHALECYYLCKLMATMSLLDYKKTGNTVLKEEAIKLLKEALAFWIELSQIGAKHYMPYYMGRVNQTFGWSYYIGDAERDVAIAKGM